MTAKIISQKKFAKLVASTGPLAQPPGAITRASNLLFTTRGSLQISSGSFALPTIPEAPTAFGQNTAILNIAPFSLLIRGQFPSYVFLVLNTEPEVPNVTGFSATPSPGPGNGRGSYTFGIVGTAGGLHSDIGASQFSFNYTSIFAFGTVVFTWGHEIGATGYDIYYFPDLIANPQQAVLLQSVGITTTYTFSGTLPTTPLTLAPFGNNSYLLQLSSGNVRPGDVNNLLVITAIEAGVFPGTLPLAASLTPGSPGFNSFTSVAGFSPYGGLPGSTCPIPEIIQFAGKAILILGNGYPPQATNPTLGFAAPVTPLANTFTAAYPDWQPSVDWVTGSLVTDGAGNYYTATQGGVSQTPGPPSWNIAKGDVTADGSVIWTSNGPIVASTAPRGAAHAVAYAGSLWLANTSPTDTSDGIDGPTCLKMSDANNSNSWNPINTAFIGRNDGTQITGLQPFTIAALGISPTGSLCVFKEFTTYQVIGVFGSTTFEIQPAQTNLGCLAARSIQFIPGFGIIRFTHLGFAVFDGINDRLVSEDIRPYLFGGVDSEADLVPVDPSFAYRSVAAQTITPPMYLCAMPLAANPTGATGTGSLTRLFCYDLVMKSWAVLDLPWAIDSLATMSVGEGYPLVLAGKSDGSIPAHPGWRHKLGSGRRRAVAGGDGRSGSPDVFGEGSSQRLFYEQATIRGYGSATMVKSDSCKPMAGRSATRFRSSTSFPRGGSNLFEARVSIFRNGYRAHLDVSGNNGGAATSIDAIDWAVSPKSALARRVISVSQVIHVRNLREGEEAELPSALRDTGMPYLVPEWVWLVESRSSCWTLSLFLYLSL